MARVYVIEDDVSLRDILLQALQQALGIEALGFGQVDEALQAWPQYPPDMVLSELKLPGRSGLELATELEACGWYGPLVFFSDYLDEFTAEIPSLPRLALLAKPFDLHALLEYVAEELANPSTIEAAPAAPFGLFDYVQLSCVGGHTVEINVFSPEDHSELVGRVVILGGELWSVQDAQGLGTDAFLRLACLLEPHVTCNALLNTTLARNIPCSWDALMLRAAALRDDVIAQQFGSYEGVHGDGEAAHGWNSGEQGGYPMPDQGFPASNEAAPAYEPSLHDLVQAANAAEDAGQAAQALAILEQAMVRFPGHPEILLAVLRLQKSAGRE